MTAMTKFNSYAYYERIHFKPVNQNQIIDHLINPSQRNSECIHDLIRIQLMQTTVRLSSLLILLICLFVHLSLRADLPKKNSIQYFFGDYSNINGTSFVFLFALYFSIFLSGFSNFMEIYIRYYD